MMPGEDEVVSELDDAALFAAASAPPSPEPQETPAEPVAEAAPPVVEQKPTEPDQKLQEPDHRVPLRELLDERERRQEGARQYADLQRQYAEMQRQVEALRNPQRPVDLLTDPQRFQETIEQRLERHQNQLEQRMRAHSINTSFAFAERQHGEEFRKAFAALEEAAAPNRGGDLMLRDRIVNSPDPGEAVVQWHRSRQILQESGGDLSAYRERLLKEERERLAKDPDFRKQVLETLRTEAANRPPVTQMPSLNRAPAAAPNAVADDAREMSDADLFRYASRPRQRR